MVSQGTFAVRSMASILSAMALASVSTIGIALAQQPSPANTTAKSISPDEARVIAREAYIYLYPLMTMDLTRKQLVNTVPAKGGIGGAPNSFNHVRTFPDADMRAVVRPNFDTLYSSAWLDLTGGPIVVSTADTGGRYFLLPMIDMWTDVFAAPGKRTQGTGAANFAVVPPGWTGTLPADVERIQAPTPYVWIIGRTQTNGVKDYDAVHKVQDGYRITPLSNWGKAPQEVVQKIDPSVDTKTPPLQQVNSMPARDYFKYGADLMKQHPPHVTDWSILARMKRIGIEPGKFDSTRIGDDALANGAAAGLQYMTEKASTLARTVNGWQMNTDTMGVYGDYYLKRAIVSMIGLGANQPEDAIYPLNIADADGDPVMGEYRYVLHFAKSDLPPADAFWSLTMYDEEGFQVANPINRFAIGDRDALKYNPDGSLDLFIQHENPGPEQEANWLPAPKSGKLGLTLRLYAPRAEALDGRWNPPAIKRSTSIGRALQ
jgi:hypothetical protein